jgi:hypothetical protein
LQPIIQDEVSQINSVRNDASMSMDQKRAKVEEIKKTSFPKILAVLTPEQRKKLSDMQQRARQEAQQQQQMNAPANSEPAGGQPNGMGSGQPGMQGPGSTQPGAMGQQPGAGTGATPPTSPQTPH